LPELKFLFNVHRLHTVSQKTFRDFYHQFSQLL
jgi:hypothetical protein